MATPRPLVHLEDGVLTGMAVSDAFVREFPFLRNLAATLKALPSKCSACARSKAARDRAHALLTARAAIAGLPAERKRRLKELLGARQVRLRYVVAAGNARKVMELTF